MKQFRRTVAYLLVLAIVGFGIFPVSARAETVNTCAHDYSADPAICSSCGNVRVSQEIESVSLRPSCAGLYFKGNFVFDDQTQPSRYGIAVSLSNKNPMADDTDGTSAYTSGQYSVLITNILTGGADDADNGAMKIYARAYTLLADGTYLYANTVSLSLQQLTEAVNDQWSALNDVQKSAAKAMYDTYSATMESWDVPELKDYIDPTIANCSHCNQNVKWTEWNGTTTASGHYYLSKNITKSAQVTLSNPDFVLDLRGNTLESSYRKVFLVQGDGALFLMDSSAEKTGSVVGLSASYNAGVLQASEGGEIVIYGGNYRVTDSGKTNSNGGLIYISGDSSTNISTVTIKGGNFVGTRVEGNGGIIAANAFSKLIIEGGNFISGTAEGAGDGIAVVKNTANVEIKGGTFSGDIAITTAKSAKLSGEVIINKGNEGGLMITEGVKVDATGLTAGSNIVVYADGVFTTDFASEAAAEEAKGYFTADTGMKVVVEGLALAAIADTTEPEPVLPGDKVYCAYGHTTHKGVTCDAELLVWSEWTETTSLPTTGSYYLNGDVTIKDTSKPSNLNLDLNGCDVTRIIEVGDTDDCNVFSVASGKSFLLTDTNAERHGIVSVTWEEGAETANASKLGKVVKVSTNSTMKLYGGIIDGSNITGNTSDSNNGTVNIQNGTNTVGKFYMYGGKILGIQNYYIASGSTTKTYNSGSAITAMTGTTLEIYGGEIIGGEAKNGACIHSNATNTKLLGGKYTGGTVSSSAAIAYINAYTTTIGDVDMDGGIFIYKQAEKLILVGSPKITNEGISTYGICFGSSSTGVIDATGLDADARINIRTSREDVESAFAKVDEDLSGCFTVWNEGYRVRYNEADQTLSLEAYSSIESSPCYCKDCNGVTVPQWTAWDGTTELTAGHYYLAADTEMTASGVIDSAEAATVVVNMNGFTLSKSEAGRMFQLKGKTNLVLMDSSAYETGKVIGNGVNDSGMIVMIDSADASAEIYGGNFSLVNADTQTANGALFCVNAGSLKIAGGDFTGATADQGGVVAVSEGGTLEITGGTFHAGTAANGDTLYAASDATLTIGGNAQFEGGVEIAEDVQVTISGTPVIRKASDGSAYALKSDSVLSVGELTVGARVFVTGTEAAVFGNVVTDAQTPDVIGRFFSADSENMRVVAEGNALKVIPMVIDPDVIQQRRDQVEAYMRKMATTLWTATEDITYCFSRTTDDPSTASSSQLIHIKAGRTYMGLPYAYSATTRESFLDYAGEPDEKGIYPISGLTYQAMSGLSSQTRMGNDCSSSVATSWSIIGASVYATTSAGYVPRYGIVNIGDYIPEESYGSTGTAVVIEKNGAEVMYESYALLQKADALVRYKSANNHTMMVVSVTVVRNEDGSINPTQSYAIVLEQTSTNVRNERTKTVEGIGTVYEIYGVDKKYSFEYLVNNTYIPVTCMELVDASPIPEVEISDSIEVPTVDNLFEGTITCSNFVDCVTITITDKDGKVVQQAAQNAYRSRQREFRMEEFITGLPRNWSRGVIELDALPVGAYHCDVVCRLTTQQEFTVREFDFTVS